MSWLMKSISLGAIPVLVTLSSSSFGAERTVTLEVDNMTCAACAPIVESSLKQVSGVANVAISRQDGTAAVTFDDAKARLHDLIAATTEAGYPSHLKE